MLSIANTTGVSKRFNDSLSKTLCSVSKRKALVLLILIFGLGGSVSAASVECDSCADCAGKLNGNYGEIRLNTSIHNHPGTCITFGAGNVTFDCRGHTIGGNGTDYGIYTSENNTKIQNCVIADFYFGIFLGESSNSTVVNNTISSAGNGIYLGWASNNDIINNTVYSNDISGIYLDLWCTNNSIANNMVHSNNVSGIYLRWSTNNGIINNTVYSNNNSGIYLDWNSTSNNLINNNITDNAKNGVYFSSSSNDNDLTSNSICENGIDINDSGSNSGDDNTCDTTSNWNDTGAEGCTNCCMHALQYNLYKIPNLTGLNLISLPLVPLVPIMTAEDLCNAIPNTETISWWDPIEQKDKTHTCNLPFTDFPLSPLGGYKVAVSVNTTWTLEGYSIIPEPIDLITAPNSASLNQIGLPYNSKISPFTAQGLCQNISNSGTVTRWDPVVQKYKSHTCNLPFTDFPLSVGGGYMVSVSANTTWTPS